MLQLFADVVSVCIADQIKSIFTHRRLYVAPFVDIHYRINRRHFIRWNALGLEQRLSGISAALCSPQQAGLALVTRLIPIFPDGKRTLIALSPATRAGLTEEAEV